MGRTVAPFSSVLAYYVDGLKPWREQMTAGDRAAFDRIFEAAHYHMPSCVMASSLDPDAPILLSGMLELRKAVKELEAQVTELERRMKAVEKDE